MTRSFVHENQRLLKQNGDPQMHIETYPNNQQEKYEAAKIVMLPTTNMSKKAAKVDGTHPRKQSLHEFFAKVAEDPDWFPGKHCGKKRGPTPLLTKAKRRALAQCAMKIKERGDVPTAEEVVQHCPAQTLVAAVVFGTRRTDNTFQQCARRARGALPV